jgi:hypothetical protein
MQILLQPLPKEASLPQLWKVSRHHLTLFYSVVCAWCSEKEDYVAGYGDERVRICDTCYRDKKKFRRLQQRKYSFVSIY